MIEGPSWLLEPIYQVAPYLRGYDFFVVVVVALVVYSFIGVVLKLVKIAAIGLVIFLAVQFFVYVDSNFILTDFLRKFGVPSEFVGLGFSGVAMILSSFLGGSE